MARFTNSEIEAHKAKQTIRFYLAGGFFPRFSSCIFRSESRRAAEARQEISRRGERAAKSRGNVFCRSGMSASKGKKYLTANSANESVGNGNG
jgi:hypothetical protein